MTTAIITDPSCLLHQTGIGHPDCADRIIVIANTLAKLKSIETFEKSIKATLEQLQMVHDLKYIDEIFKLNTENDLINIDSDTLIGPHTLEAALHAAGAVIQAVDLVLSKPPQINSVFCNIRPPGHHAMRDRAMGFCFFNNLAIGVAHAIKTYNFKRIAIVDFDAHRGNGTEDIFLNSKKVLICSIYEDLLYPFDSPPENASNIINIPLAPGSTGREFRAEIIQNMLDKINAFNPEIIFCSAGFDGHEKDPISTLNLTEFDYLWLSQQLKQIADNHCKGRIISVLEGGYALDVLGSCVLAHVSGFSGN